MNQKKNGYFIENLFGRVLSPFERFLKRTTAGGIILIITLGVSLLLANSGFAQHIFDIFDHVISIGLSDWRFGLTLHSWINEGLMTLFFLLVGLELKRELMVGELSSFKAASLPVAAALGGMIIPALIYWAINPTGPAARGWGIPMATDIAFAVGILVLLSWRVPSGLLVFLTALAIADDLGAVAVIAIFYSGEISLLALASGSLLFLFLLILNLGGIRHPLPYAFLGLLLWISLHYSGIHPTMAGILLACSIPARSRFTPAEFSKRIDQLRNGLGQELKDPHSCEHPISCRQMGKVAENMEKAAKAVQSPFQRLEHTLNPWVTFIVLPIFAFSNLKIVFSEVNWEGSSSPITMGVALGLVIGKLIGITGFSFLGVKLGLGKLPSNVSWRHIIGVGWLGGIGFTMSLFVGNLAFTDGGNLEQAKIGILIASAISGIIGFVWLCFGSGKVK